MNIVLKRNVGALVQSKIASAFVSATAAGSGDNTAVTGATVDRLDSSTGGLAESAVFDIAWQATLAATKTLTIKTVTVDTSADGSTWTTGYLTFTDPGVVGTGASGGSTEKGVVQLTANLTSAQRYVRVNFTPDLSASGTDTASLVAMAVLAGQDRLPV